MDANELALVYRARGMSAEEAQQRADARMAEYDPKAPRGAQDASTYEELGSAWGAAWTSFLLFSSGAIIPVLPYLFGMTGIWAVVAAAVLVGLALLTTGAIVGLLSGSSPWARALRQLAIGWGAAAVTYALGLLFGTGAA